MQWSLVTTEYSIHQVQHTPSTAYTKYSIHQVQHTPSTAYTKYSIHQVQHTPSTPYTQYSIHPVQHTLCTAYTEYSIHRVQHTPSTAYTEYSRHRVQHTLSTVSSHDWLSPTPSQFLISRRAILYSTPYIPTIMSKPMARFTSAVRPPSRSTASRSTISKYSSNLNWWSSPSASSTSLDQSLLVHLGVTGSWPPSESPNSHNHGLQVHLRVTQSWPPSESPNSLDHSLQVYLWVQLDLGLQVHLAVTRSRTPNASPNLLDHGLQVHLHTRSITASKRISEVLDLCLQSHLHTGSITTSKCISEFDSMLPSKCISKLTWSQPLGTSRSSHDHRLQVPLYVTSIMVSRYSCDYAPVLSAAKLAICIYIQRLE